MLGDIVTNNANGAANGTATAARPQPHQAGYGSAGFGQPKRPVVGPSARPVNAPRQPATVAPQSQPIAQAPAQPAAQAPATPQAVVMQPVTMPGAKTKKSGSKVPLVLMIIGVVVFIGGVAALFMYALGGQ